MKKFLQLFLFFLLIIVVIIFYLNFFKSDKNIKLADLDNDRDTPDVLENKNNLIKNLKYEVNFDNNTQYEITANFSELMYEDNIEIVDMKKVTAIFIDKENIPLTITSENALYNNSNYNTNFYKNVRIEYSNNVILSDKLDVNFNENIVKIYENVVYDGLQGVIKADNVILNLITKNMKIFMKNSNEKVEISSK